MVITDIEMVSTVVEVIFGILHLVATMATFTVVEVINNTITVTKVSDKLTTKPAAST